MLQGESSRQHLLVSTTMSGPEGLTETSTGEASPACAWQRCARTRESLHSREGHFLRCKSGTTARERPSLAPSPSSVFHERSRVRVKLSSPLRTLLYLLSCPLFFSLMLQSCPSVFCPSFLSWVPSLLDASRGTFFSAHAAVLPTPSASPTVPSPQGPQEDVCAALRQKLLVLHDDPQAEKKFSALFRRLRGKDDDTFSQGRTPLWCSEPDISRSSCHSRTRTAFAVMGLFF